MSDKHPLYLSESAANYEKNSLANEFVGVVLKGTDRYRRFIRKMAVNILRNLSFDI